MYRFYVRKFLNRRGHHAAAYVYAFVEQGRDDAYDDEPIFELTDCYRRVELEFPLDSAASRANSVRKARVLAEAAAGFADALEAEAAAIAEREARRRRERPRTPRAAEVVDEPACACDDVHHLFEAPRAG